MNKDQLKKAVKEYPKRLEVYPREAFEEQLYNFIRNKILK